MGQGLMVRRRYMQGEKYVLPVLNASYPANAALVLAAPTIKSTSTATYSWYKTTAAVTSVSLSVSIATAGVPAEYTYQWFNTSGAISGATSSTYTAKAAGSYYCNVTNKAGTVKSRTATVSSSVGGWILQITNTSAGTLIFDTINDASIGICAVGGGGGGGYGYNYCGGGGGGGGYVVNKTGYAAKAGTTYNVLAGAGGAASTTNSTDTVTNTGTTGTASYFKAGSTAIVTASGGVGGKSARSGSNYWYGGGGAGQGSGGKGGYLYNEDYPAASGKDGAYPFGSSTFGRKRKFGPGGGGGAGCNGSGATLGPGKGGQYNNNASGTAGDGCTYTTRASAPTAGYGGGGGGGSHNGSGRTGRPGARGIVILTNMV